ncbi:MAG: hypothetical protein H6722_13340 [Sandaracinus sp.]|nr:hypothetical protein [Sandaracinus sp.]
MATTTSPRTTQTADRCVDTLEGALDRVLTQPDPYRDDPNVEGADAVLAVTLLAEVDHPRARARFAALLDHPNEKIQVQVRRFMAAHPSVWREELVAQIDAPNDRARGVALEGLIGERDPAVIDRVRVAAERTFASGAIPWAEARVLAAANDTASAPLLERVGATCPPRAPAEDAASALWDRYSQCAEIDVYRYGFGGPVRLAQRAVDGPGGLRQGRAVMALGRIDAARAKPVLLRVLQRREPSLAVTFAGPTARRLGLHEDPAIAASLRRWAAVDNAWMHEMPHALPDGDEAAILRLVQLVEAEPSLGAGHVAELIRRGSAEADRLVHAARQGGASPESYLATRHPFAHRLAALTDPRVNGYLDAFVADRDLPPSTRLAAALVRARRGGAVRPELVDTVLTHGEAYGYDVYDTMLAAAACVASGS